MKPISMKGVTVKNMRGTKRDQSFSFFFIK